MKYRVGDDTFDSIIDAMHEAGHRAWFQDGPVDVLDEAGESTAHAQWLPGVNAHVLIYTMTDEAERQEAEERAARSKR